MTTCTQVETSFDNRSSVAGSAGRGCRRRGFTLIELLVVLVIIGILCGLILGPLRSFLWNAEQTATKAQFRQYQTALALYISDNGPPAFFESETPYNLSEKDVREKFIISLKGKKLVNDKWLDLNDQEKRYNPDMKEYYDFDEEEFDDDGNLVDAWGNSAIKIIVDWDGDGFIQLPTDSEVEELNGERIQKDVVVYVLSKDDPSGEGGGDVFSWVD